jgi:predicted nucleic acid-binding Zn ribbon protein
MESAGRLIGKLKVSKGLADPESRVRAAWNVAAGKKIAVHTRATTLVRNTLIVEVEDPIWQRQLNTLRHFLLRNLRTALGESLVEDIDFRPMPARRKPQLAESARPAAPMTQETIHDPVLAALYRQSKRRNFA